jgi:pimeloyl-ACP methyl ester carboxylesterase
MPAQAWRTGFRPRLHRATLLLILVVAVPPGGRAQGLVPRFEPSGCDVHGDWMSGSRVECGHVIVPEVRDRHSGRTLRLAVMVIRAAEPAGRPPLVFLHGGPGLNAITSRFPMNAVRWGLSQHRDVVIYDQRGAGLSEPRLCSEVVESSGDIADASRAAAAARACIAELRAAGIDPAAFSTPANAADATDIRRALGYRVWDIYGVSYGSRLAQELMRRDSASIRAVVLDRPMPVGVRFYAEKRRSFQTALQRVFKACAAQPACHAAFPSVEEDFYAVYDELRMRPIEVVPENSPSAPIRLDGERFVREIQYRLGSSRLIPTIPLLLNELRRGDHARAARALAATIGAIERLNPTNQLVSSHDVCGKELTSARELVRQQLPAAFDSSFDWMTNCSLWQERFADRSTFQPVRSSLPTLIVTAEFDDRTPTVFGSQIAATLKRSYQFEMHGEVHGMETVSDCHGAILRQFLEHPQREPDSSCADDPTPLVFETNSLELRTFLIRIAAEGPQPTALAGQWRAVLPGPQATVDFDLRAVNGVLVGAITPNAPQGDLSANAVQIIDGRLEGAALRFKVKSPEGARTISFVATLAGDELTFTREVEVAPNGDPGREGIFGVLGPSTFTATRTLQR